MIEALKDYAATLHDICDPRKAHKMAGTAASLLSAILKGEISEKQMGLIQRICMGDIGQKFPKFVATVAAAKVMTVDIGGITVVARWTNPASPRAKAENRGSIAISAGEYGTADAKWFGRVMADGSVSAGKDWNDAIAEWVASVEQGE
jgi:hypothetical protein